MGVTTTKINKPLNPRGNDQSPLAYNRAALYSGKALSFDGVNDYVASSAFSLDTSEWSASMILKNDTAVSDQVFFTFSATGSNDESFIIYNNFANSNKISFYGAAFTGSPVIFDYVIPTDYEHLTFTFANNTLSLYVNGVFVDSGSVTGNDGTQTASAIVGARRLSSYVQFFNGQVSGLKMYSTALTPAQIADLYNFPEKIVPTGVANTALKLWLPMMEGAGTTAINGAPDALGSELITNGDFATDSNWTKEGSWTISGGVASISSSTNDRIYQSVSLDANKKYLLSINVTSISTASIRFRFGGNGSASSLAEITTPGIYNFISAPLSGTSSVGIFAVSGASATIDDISVKEISNNGTISGATWTNGIGAPVSQTAVIDWNKHTLDGTNAVLIPQGLTTGRDLLGNLFENVRKQGALNLDGQSWAEVHDNASLDLTTAVTLEAWVYWGGSLDNGIIGKWDYNQNKASYLLYKSSATRFIMYVSSNGSTLASETNDTNISSGWNHLVGVYDGANLKCYLNGVVDGSSAYSSGLYSSDAVVEIGRYDEGSSTSYTNQLAQPRIYNRALTAEEVQRNYNAGKNIYS